MKIAQVVSLQASVPPNTKNGLEFIVYYLTEELVKRGHEVTLFAPGNSKTSAKLISLYPQGIYGEPNVLLPSGAYSLWNAFYCSSLCKNFDIIHSHLGDMEMFFSHFINTPVISTIHGPEEPAWKLYSNNQEYYKFTKPIIDFLKNQEKVFVSKNQQKNSCFNNKSNVVLNGIPVKDFIFSNEPADYFAFLGYLNYNKGAHIAIKVAKKAKIKLKLAGHGSKDFLEKEIYPNLDKNIEYIGPIAGKEKNNFLKNAKALLAPIQWDEPFGLVMPEAMACGTPVIAFNRAAVPEIVKDRETGFIVNNEEAMINAITKIDKINRFACRKHVEENFTIKRMVDEYEQLYQKIINDNKKNK